MNKELLIKLIKLANHNNADGEANAAARRVCKMIENDQFKCLGQEIKGKPMSVPFTYTTQPTSNPPNSIYDYVKEKFYTNKTYDPFHGHYKVNIDFDEPFYTEKSREPKPPPVYSRDGYIWDERENRWKSGKPRRALKCKSCSTIVNTIYQGLEDLFECNDCQWTAYERKKK